MIPLRINLFNTGILHGGSTWPGRQQRPWRPAAVLTDGFAVLPVGDFEGDGGVAACPLHVCLDGLPQDARSDGRVLQVAANGGAKTVRR